MQINFIPRKKFIWYLLPIKENGNKKQFPMPLQFEKKIKQEYANI